MGVKTATEPVYTTPDETIAIALDYDNGDLPDGASINSIAASAATSGLTLVSTTFSGNVVTFTVKNGTANNDYDVWARCIFSDLQTREGSVTVKVRER